EATEIDIATKFAGRVDDILVGEGDFVTAGQVLARMQVETLQAQYDEAVAGEHEARQATAAAQAQIAQRRSDVAAQQAVVVQ
ncbi:MAG TPA: biotin/lipoyl-binding protein, partial [Rhodocyclaceae bacterium]|nr:biotin/lipoyl-binding protein [Rhodocyclaceae bacterium]